MTVRNAAGGPGQNQTGLGQTLQQGVQYHQSGNLALAAQCYEKVLAHQPTQPDALHLLGVVHHQGGEHAKAVDLIKRSLKKNPKNPDAYSNLGAAQTAIDDLKEAANSFKRAVKLNPRFVDAHANLAAISARIGDVRSAQKSFEIAHKLKPDEPRFLKRLAELYLDHGQFTEAVDWYSRFLSLSEGDATTHNNLAYALEHVENFVEAEGHYRRALELEPDKPETLNNLGTVLQCLEKFDEARALFDEALTHPADRWEDPQHLAGALFNNGKFEEALALYDELARERPTDVTLHHDFGAALLKAGRLEAAEMVLRNILATGEGSDASCIELARCFLIQKNLDEAIELLRKIRKGSPYYLAASLDLSLVLAALDELGEATALAHDVARMKDFRPSMFMKPYTVFRAACAFDDIENLPISLSEVEDYDLSKWAGVFLELLTWADTPEKIGELADMHCRWGDKITRGAEVKDAAVIDLSNRSGSIRVGFVSSDLRRHSVARFVLPLFENYDRSQIEIYCYSPKAAEDDDIQSRIRGLVKEFRITGTGDYKEAAQIIRDDEIDILFELNGFTADSQFSVMAHRPAPVQVCWLGYPFTRGMAAMDYVLLDEDVAPAESDWLIEKPLIMPGSWVCYDPFEAIPTIENPPVHRNGYVTIGTLNNPYKFTREAIALWAKVLKQLPDARYLFAHPEYREQLVVENIVREFEAQGVTRDRLTFTNNRESGLSHFSFYNEIDLTLDSFPLTGGTTSCDALWMGVPIVTKYGPSVHQRLTYSHLCDLGLRDLCVETDEAYIDVAIELAQNHGRLVELRRNLRNMVKDSPLGKAEEFGRNFSELMVKVASDHCLR
ncbi:MAG: tetratricopeptide repeat protein [Alphaproteobacteria bacterium]|nr:tetratricopeptide repeat protein [Alphaproteobacteria bacterium]